MQIAIVTIFPQMFDSFVCEGMTRRALETGQLQLEFRNPRDFTEDSHRQVDDRPYGGGNWPVRPDWSYWPVVTRA